MKKIEQELTLTAIPENIEAFTNWGDKVLVENGCPSNLLPRVNVVLDEAYSNISRYAYPNAGGTLTVKLSVSDNKPEIELQFIDSGVPYDEKIF